MAGKRLAGHLPLLAGQAEFIHADGGTVILSPAGQVRFRTKLGVPVRSGVTLFVPSRQGLTAFRLP